MSERSIIVRKMLKSLFEFVLRHLLWLLSCAGGFYLLLRTRITILLAITSFFEAGAAGPYRAALVDRWGIIIMAIVLLVFVVLIEYHYTGAKSQRDLLGRFLCVTGIEILVLAGLDAFLQIIIGIDARSTLTVLIFAAELVIGVLLVTHPSWWPKLFMKHNTNTSSV